MDNLFSDRPPSPPAAEPLEDVLCTVEVPAPAAQAFDGFTDAIHLWWPIATHGVYGEGSYVGFEDDELVETADDGRAAVWAEVTAWIPSRQLCLAWHPAAGPLAAQPVEVSFTEEGTATAVTLRHGGWDGRADGAAERERYSRDWPAVLARYVRFMGGREA
ncbi:SRPBCC domain-containing protein [Paenarthrobacter sp. DKR-5]|uniref:SRPBCC domain-containing protein n=1 Tax=Paenarthrobacter sp. DKR-5 TaxID=2835535 RepID=UPI001BDCEB50|nr:SRPBCC domain-containing protein [Paenarthrobacter sp. DKR-5]MBT1004388.1 SRPBCC domain-containing protein [Paenarthrobacter sp. DKR-5]